MSYNFYTPRLADLDAEERRLRDRLAFFTFLLDGAILGIDQASAQHSEVVIFMQNLQIASTARKMVRLTEWQLRCLDGIRRGIYNSSAFPLDILTT